MMGGRRAAVGLVPHRDGREWAWSRPQPHPKELTQGLPRSPGCWCPVAWEPAKCCRPQFLLLVVVPLFASKSPPGGVHPAWRGVWRSHEAGQAVEQVQQHFSSSPE